MIEGWVCDAMSKIMNDKIYLAGALSVLCTASTVGTVREQKEGAE